MRAVFVEHGTHASVLVTSQQNFAFPQGAALDKHRCDRAASLIQTRLNHHPARRAIVHCLQLEGLEQIVHALAGLRRDVHEHRIATPLFRNHFLLYQLLLDAIGICIWLIDLVDGDHNRHPARLRVLDGFLGLRHHTIIGRYD